MPYDKEIKFMPGKSPLTQGKSLMRDRSRKYRRRKKGKQKRLKGVPGFQSATTDSYDSDRIWAAGN